MPIVPLESFTLKSLLRKRAYIYMHYANELMVPASASPNPIEVTSDMKFTDTLGAISTYKGEQIIEK